MYVCICVRDLSGALFLRGTNKKKRERKPDPSRQVWGRLSKTDPNLTRKGNAQKMKKNEKFTVV